MVSIQRGFRSKLDKFFDISKEIMLSINIEGKSTYDSCCFGVDISNKLSDDRYMVFYNQTASPNREIVLNGSGSKTSYNISLSKIPNQINKLVFTVSIDGNGSMSEISNLCVAISQGGEILNLDMKGSDFRDEKAVIAIEFYQKDGWKMAVVAGGFNGGLSALLKHYGGEEIEDENAKNQSSKNQNPSQVFETSKISLEKRLEKEAPQLVSLAKPLKISLEKNNLNDVVAQVALLIDISGSMSKNFEKGVVQNIINKVVPLAMQFDDNSEFELWYFGTRSKRMNAVKINNYMQAANDWKNIMSSCGYGTDLSYAIREVVENYKESKIPAYVLCITDGATSNGRKVEELICSSANYPIFWQFIGISDNPSPIGKFFGGFSSGSFGILEKLDTMSGRIVDNANFFSLNDIDNVDNTQLYTRMLAEFPIWLKEAKRLNIIR